MSDELPPIDPLAPKHLDRLNQQMRAWVEQDKIKTANRGSQVVVKKEIPCHYCQVCGKTHSPKLVEADRALTAKPCESCQANLDLGMIAVHCEQPPRRYAFLYSSDLVGQPQILEVQSGVMDMVEQRLKEMKEQNEQNSNGGTSRSA